MPKNKLQGDLLSTSASFDLKVEALASALISRAAEGEFELDQIVVSLQGHAKRLQENEVREVRKKYYDEETVLVVKANRKGIFDNLPKGLFIDANEKDYPTAKKRTRAIQQQTREARNFFLPFEQAIYHPRIEIDQLEQQWTQKFPNFVHRIWGLDKYADKLDERQLFLLCYLLPEARRVVGDWRLTGLCLEAVLQKPVNLSWIAPLECKIPKNSASFDEERLGISTILGDKFRDDSPALVVSIKGITFSELLDYLPYGDMRIILEELLYSYFLPLEVNLVTEIIPTDDAWSGEFGRMILGYNCILE